MKLILSNLENFENTSEINPQLPTGPCDYASVNSSSAHPPGLTPGH